MAPARHVRPRNGRPAHNAIAFRPSEDCQVNREAGRHHEQCDRERPGGRSGKSSRPSGTACPSTCRWGRYSWRGPTGRDAPPARSPASRLKIGEAPQTQQRGIAPQLPSAFTRAQVFPTRAPNRLPYVNHLRAFLHDARNSDPVILRVTSIEDRHGDRFTIRALNQMPNQTRALLQDRALGLARCRKRGATGP
jgi:hypothetical protein